MFQAYPTTKRRKRKKKEKSGLMKEKDSQKDSLMTLTSRQVRYASTISNLKMQSNKSNEKESERKIQGREIIQEGKGKSNLRFILFIGLRL